MMEVVITTRFSINGTIYERVDGRENKGNANERERFHQNIFICIMILKGDLKGFQENFKTFFQVPPIVSGPHGENTDHSQNQSDCRICRILPTHELRKKWLFFGAFLIKQ